MDSYQINLESVGDVEYPLDGGMFNHDTEKMVRKQIKQPSIEIDQQS